MRNSVDNKLIAKNLSVSRVDRRNAAGDANRIDLELAHHLVMHLQAGTLPAPLARFIWAAHAEAEQHLGVSVPHLEVVKWLPKDALEALGGSSAALAALHTAAQAEPASTPPAGEAHRAIQRRDVPVPGRLLVSTLGRLERNRAASKRRVLQQRMAYDAVKWRNKREELRVADDDIKLDESAWERGERQSHRKQGRDAAKLVRALDEALNRVYASALSATPGDWGTPLVVSAATRLESSRASREVVFLDAPGVVSTLQAAVLRAHEPQAVHPPFHDAT